jgi:hypothetical protein
VTKKSAATKRDPPRDIRAADLQEEPTKRFQSRANSAEMVVSSDPTKTAASAKIAASEASH